MERIGVLTSGGDSPGMNAAIRAVVRAGAYYDMEVYGIEHGFQGMIDGDIRRLGARDVSGIINRGGTFLRTARCKAFFDEEGRSVAAKNLGALGIEGIVVIGGDGSYRGALALHREHGIRVIGMPGTIDNDIGGTDYTIGYDTALNIAVDAIDRLRDTANSHDRLFFVEVMGRHSGYIAMMSGLAGGAEEILTPEHETTIEQVVRRLQEERSRGKAAMIVVVAEGDEAGSAFTIADAVRKELDSYDIRVTVVGHLQRGGSPTAFDRVLAGRMGVHAVEALRQGETGKMVGISKDIMVLRPLEEAWTHRTTYDASLHHIASVLAI